MKKDKVFKMLACIFFCFFLGCEKKTVLTEMKELVPLLEGATVSDSYMPDTKTAVMKVIIDASIKSNKDILDFYKDQMSKKGWEQKTFKDYGEDGCVMELAEKDSRILAIQTITKATQKTGKIDIIFNLTKR